MWGESRDTLTDINKLFLCELWQAEAQLAPKDKCGMEKKIIIKKEFFMDAQLLGGSIYTFCMYTVWFGR